MRRTAHILFPGLAAAVFLLAGCGTLHRALFREEPYVEKTGRKGWHLFLHPAYKTPQLQLNYADSLLQARKTRAAMRQYLALTVYWPESAEAGKAQYQYAKLTDRRGKPFATFDEYQRLFDRYTGLFPYDEVLNRQFELATNVMERKKGRFLLFGGFSAPERAIPLFESILTNAPQGEKAAECQYRIGRAYELSLQYEEAIDAYMTTQSRYLESPFAEKGSYGAAYCFYLLAQESPNNQQILEGAWAAMTLFLNTYPSSQNAAVAMEYRKTLLRERAKLAYDKACYYDKIARRPKAALIAYQDFVRGFPHSDWTALAQIRIDALSKIVETQNE
ncbi:MAG: outer membrane protein assembly factor BamD [Verrucomicrobiota bacterium]